MKFKTTKEAKARAAELIEMINDNDGEIYDIYADEIRDLVRGGLMNVQKTQYLPGGMIKVTMRERN